MFKPEGSEEGGASLKSECLVGGRMQMMHAGITAKAKKTPKKQWFGEAGISALATN